MPSPSPSTRPSRLLLATDLTSRTDRAFDRAVQLASTWDAELHVIHAVGAQAPPVPLGVDADVYLRDRPDPATEAMRHLERHLALEGVAARVHVEDASPARAILETTQREGCGLIVMGESRDRLSPLEGTVEQVVRSAPASVLAVRNRPYGPYRRLLVGTDFSDEARQALVAAAALFPDAGIDLVHAYDMPYAGLLQPPGNDPAWAADRMQRLRAHLADARIPDELQASIRLSVEAGPPASVLPRHVRHAGTELTVIGAHPRSLVFDAMVGSSRLIVDAIPGDVLVVRATRSG